MNNIYITFLTTFFFFNTSSGQNTGKVVYKEIGLEFRIPNGWIGQESEGGFIMGHETIPGMIILLIHEQQYSIKQLEEEAKAGINLGSSSYLRPKEALTFINDQCIGGVFEGVLDLKPATAYIIGKTNPYGFGVTIMALTTSELFNINIYQPLSKDLSSSILFTKVLLSTGNDAGSWKKELNNTRLTYLDSYYSGGAGNFGGGYSSKTVIDLCAAGYFNYYENSSISVSSDHSGAYSHGSTDGNGQWSILEKSGASFLILKFYDGSNLEYKLEWKENKKLFLDEYRYFRTWSGEEAPNCK